MSPTTVPLRVTAIADGGPVAQVQYLITSGPTFTVTSFPFSYDWVNPSAGSYSIQAFAYDNSGARGQSASSSITVTQDAPPAVGLIPTNGSSFITPITIPVIATATSSSSTVTNVSILINGNAVRLIFILLHLLLGQPVCRDLHRLRRRNRQPRRHGILGDEPGHHRPGPAPLCSINQPHQRGNILDSSYRAACGHSH